MSDENIVVKEVEILETVEELRQKKAVEEIGEQFSFYGLVSLVMGVCYSICLYQNPNGILVPVFVILFYGASYLVLKKMEYAMKKESYVIMGISVLIGISTCRTANEFFLFYNRVALFLLAIVFWLHQCYEDRDWNIGKYAGSMIVFCCHAISTVGYPFLHGVKFLKSLKDKRFQTLFLILTGVVCSIPLVLILAVLLSQADMVFQDMLADFIGSFFHSWNLAFMTWKGVIGFIGMYCLICGIAKRGISDTQKDCRTKEPVIAITVMVIVGLLYLMFCFVQIVYLFMGRGTLPSQVTYSEYARQGFFQLVFVAVMNLVMVLVCLKFFRKSRLLNWVLTIISVCTYVMIASAGYRMILYVQEYHLTLLRILVLWFLAVLSVLMAGVVLVIYRNRFPLFHYCLMVVSVGYLALVWVKPDYMIADYNIRHEKELTDYEIKYLSHLSADAAPVLWELAQMELSEYGRLKIDEYFLSNKIDMTWRTYNFSYGKAQTY